MKVFVRAMLMMGLIVLALTPMVLGLKEIEVFKEIMQTLFDWLNGIFLHYSI